jgi:hypothetical protein
VRASRRAPDPGSLPPETRLHYSEGEEYGRIPPAAAAWALGGLAFLAALFAWTPLVSWLAWIDLPVNLLIFLACAWISLTDLRETWRALPGVVLAAAAVTVSALHLILDRAHPWLG